MLIQVSHENATKLRIFLEFEILKASNLLESQMAEDEEFPDKYMKLFKAHRAAVAIATNSLETAKPVLELPFTEEDFKQRVAQLAITIQSLADGYRSVI